MSIDKDSMPESLRTRSSIDIGEALWAATQMIIKKIEETKAMSTERCPTCGSNDRRFKWDQYDPDVAQPCHDSWHTSPAIQAEIKKLKEKYER